MFKIASFSRKEFTHMFLSLYTFAVTCAHMTLQLLLCVLTAWHGYEECIINDLVTCILATVFTACVVWSNVYPLLVSCCCRFVPLRKQLKASTLMTSTVAQKAVTNILGNNNLLEIISGDRDSGKRDSADDAHVLANRQNSQNNKGENDTLLPLTMGGDKAE